MIDTIVTVAMITAKRQWSPGILNDNNQWEIKFLAPCEDYYNHIENITWKTNQNVARRFLLFFRSSKALFIHCNRADHMKTVIIKVGRVWIWLICYFLLFFFRNSQSIRNCHNMETGLNKIDTSNVNHTESAKQNLEISNLSKYK